LQHVTIEAWRKIKVPLLPGSPGRTAAVWPPLCVNIDETNCTAIITEQGEEDNCHHEPSANTAGSSPGQSGSSGQATTPNLHGRVQETHSGPSRCGDREGRHARLLRREGIYSSTLTSWRRERESALQRAFSQKRGPEPKSQPLVRENEELRRQNQRLEEELRKAEIIIEVQKKVAMLLGKPLSLISGNENS
jgi:transposase-like protein